LDDVDVDVTVFDLNIVLVLIFELVIVTLAVCVFDIAADLVLVTETLLVFELDELPVIVDETVDDLDGIAVLLGIFVLVFIDETVLVGVGDIVGFGFSVLVIDTVTDGVCLTTVWDTVDDIVLVFDDVDVLECVAVLVNDFVYIDVLVIVIVIRGVFVRRLLDVEHPELVDVLLLLADLV